MAGVVFRTGGSNVGQAWVEMRGGFGGHLSWHVECLVTLSDVLKGPKVSFCEIVFIFGFGA